MSEGKLDILLSRIEQLEAAQAASNSEALILCQALLMLDPSLFGYFERCFERLIETASESGVSAIGQSLKGKLETMRELADDIA